MRHGFAEELEFAVETAQRAGRLLMSHLSTSVQVFSKSENDPVTNADRAVDSFLREAFAERFPLDGWLSEETVDDLRRMDSERVWIVDPLDGTKEYIQRLPEFAISIALVVRGYPVAAVVLNPARNETFYALRGHGAFHRHVRIRVSQNLDFQTACVLVSRSEHPDFLSANLPAAGTLRPVGSVAYKLALVAAGQGDLTASLRFKSEWDVCAGTLLVQEAGGKVTDLQGAALAFNRLKPLVPGLIAANPELHFQACDFLTKTACFVAGHAR